MFTKFDLSMNLAEENMEFHHWDPCRLDDSFKAAGIYQSETTEWLTVFPEPCGIPLSLFSQREPGDKRQCSFVLSVRLSF